MRPMKFLGLVALLLLAPSPAAAEVWSVRALGGADFRELQHAVDAAAEGDTIVVYSGEYSSIVVQGKGLTIVAAADSAPFIHGMQVSLLPAMSTLAVRALDISKVALADCAGTVWLEDCAVRGESDPGVEIALQATNCAGVVLSRCELEGSCCSLEDGSVALLATNARIAMYDSTVRGRDGQWFTYGSGGDAGDGARIEQGSYLFASGSRIEGGDGGETYYNGLGGDGGHGLVVSPDSEAWLLATLLDGGLGGFSELGSPPGANGHDLVGNATTLPGTERRFDTERWLVPTEQTTWHVEGEPGDRVWLMAGYGASFVELLPWSGTLSLYRPQLPFGSFTSAGVLPPIPFDITGHELGTIPASGGFEVTLEVLEPGTASRTVWLQPVMLDVAGELVLASPSFVSVHGCGDESGMDCDANGIHDACELLGDPGADANGNGVLDACESSPVLHVDADAAPNGDGQSWATAYTEVHTALVNAQEVGFAGEIWVAGGTYYPPLDANFPERSTFLITAPVELYGGFAGNETSLDARDIAANPTVLSGDIDGDGTHAGNVSHVVYRPWGGPGVVLDGFVITGGHAFPPGDLEGGGLYAPAGGLTLANCVFVDNAARKDGGAIHAAGNGLALVNCAFFDNAAGDGGVGIFTESSSLTLLNCLFAGNQGSLTTSEVVQGGAVYVRDSNVTATNCVFSGNGAERAGAIYVLDNGGSSGALTLELVGCTFSGNTAKEWGGAIGIFALAGTRVLIYDSIFWRNMHTQGSDTLEEQQLWLQTGAVPEVRFCAIQGLTQYAGPGNIAFDPRFVDPDGADGLVGTGDDDLRLLLDSPCIDAARNAYVPDDVFDLDADGNVTERVPFDLDLLPRFVDLPAVPDTGSGQPPVVDMGAYERQGA